MILDRVALTDILGPKLLARGLHEQVGLITGPVPVEEIARALDIVEIRLERFDGFEGMLLTDMVRNRGGILANTRYGSRRARFTIAHELGHFLLERHVLTDEHGFRCRSADMREERKDTRHRRQEAEANSFAAELLCPASLTNPLLSADPDLRDAQRIRDALDISLEVAVRRMIDLRPEPLAAVWSENGRVRHFWRGDGFPFVTCKQKDRISQETPAARVIAKARSGITTFRDAAPMAWSDRPECEIREQTRVGKNRHAVTLLWLDQPDHDADGERDALLPEL